MCPNQEFPIEFNINFTQLFILLTNNSLSSIQSSNNLCTLGMEFSGQLGIRFD